MQKWKTTKIQAQMKHLRNLNHNQIPQSSI